MRKQKIIYFYKMAKKKIIVKTMKDLFFQLKKNPSPKVYLDNPMGTKKGFGSKKRELPFDYGELSDWINPADDMGWDIILPPSNRKQDNLIPVGYVKVNDDKKIWKEKGDRSPPIGNDKIIVANSGNISEEDKVVIEDFFSSMWQFKKIKWIL
jgi:hypothetical protein